MLADKVWRHCPNMHHLTCLCQGTVVCAGITLKGRVTAYHLEETIMRNTLKTTAAAFMLVAVTGISGCATTRDLDKIESQLASIQAAADAAAASAASAQAAADAAQACCNANTEKMDRMFKQSMAK